ncbi:N-acetylglucosamine kinase [Microvirga thermotolerans]|uniref:ATPase n=1 Tax=Microvirga thermotolerans TaxID=2651334 RepID=A0A5P9K231_9HYPH|nr:BadF/BadG/BcrA/BcrD ATPase family protein [Microvirga thermotolerans]QFU17760.1 ATPase [Microvirga thermotolerans]
MGLGLGIDAGGTATRWRLVDGEGACIAQGSAEPLTGHLFTPAAEERAKRIGAALAGAVVRTGRPAGIVAGITGLTRSTPAEATMRGILADAFGLPQARVFVAEDMWIAYLSHFALGEGILVYGGTGSIGYYLSPDKEAIRVGGRGNLIDDGGSGFWIAREALKAVLRKEEESPGEGWSAPLGAALAKALGGTEWDTVRTFVYGGDRGRIGLLARAVADAAQAGDLLSLNILREAGRELARLANSLIKRVGPRPVALVGGGTRLHPIIGAAFREELRAPVDVIDTDVDAAMTAARLAALVE